MYGIFICVGEGRKIFLFYLSDILIKPLIKEDEGPRESSNRKYEKRICSPTFPSTIFYKILNLQWFLNMRDDFYNSQNVLFKGLFIKMLSSQKVSCFSCFSSFSFFPVFQNVGFKGFSSFSSFNILCFYFLVPPPPAKFGTSNFKFPQTYLCRLSIEFLNFWVTLC